MELVVIIILLAILGVFIFLYLQESKKNLTVLENNDIIKQERIELEEKIQSNRRIIDAMDKEYEYKKTLIKDANNKAQGEYNLKVAALDKDYLAKKEALKYDYEQQNFAIQEQIDEIAQELASMKQLKASAVEAFQREESMKNDLDKYRLNVCDTDLKDIELLRSIQFKLNKPRILCMLIWQTYYAPLAKKKFPVILGKDKVCGIYKITNIKNNKCYIGKSKDVYKRFQEHCKCGLGIDTPAGNKLYMAMLEDGLNNFSFELVSVVDENQLDWFESEYIDTYNSVTWGYNGQKGNSVEK